jgi:hypothetical protein
MEQINKLRRRGAPLLPLQELQQAVELRGATLPYLTPPSISPGRGFAVCRPARSSPASHGGSLGGARRLAMEEARAEFIRHRSRPLRPHLPVSSSPRRRRPPGPCCRPPTHHRPCHLLARRASTGPTGGKGGNGRAQRGAERAKPRFLASSRPNRSRERVFRLLPQRSCFGMSFGTASPKTAPEAAGKLCQTEPYSSLMIHRVFRSLVP